MTMHFRELQHPKAGRPTAQHTYRDTSGRPVLISARFDRADGGKFFLPYDIEASDWKAPATRPLYRLDEIAAAEAGRPIVLVEGEKCADALADLGYPATTTFGGANAAHKADLSPLAGREVILWPDHDEAGERYAREVAAILRKIGAEPRIVPVSEEALCNVTIHKGAGALTYPKGWDAADAVAEGWTRAEIDRLLALAEPFTERGTAGDGVADAVPSVLELWRTPNRVAFATIDHNGYREHWPIESRHFLSLLSLQHYKAEGKAPSQNAIEDRKRLLMGQALHDGAEHPCFTRIGRFDDAVYLDLGTPDWSAVEITAEGWRVVAEPKARFTRSTGAGALPVPEPGTGDIDLLRRFVNVGSEDDFRLLVGWLIGCLRGVGPYPILMLAGEQGSAKSTSARMLRRLIDPASPETRSSPKDERDLVIAASNSHVLAFDNVSRIKSDLADALCRISTGGGFGTRKLHTNAEEMLFDVTRPCLLNGIPEFAARADLADRAIIVTLPVIAEERREYEETLWRDFEAARPRILAALLDAATIALARSDSVTLARRPRMADFARFVTAAEPALGWPEGAFLAAYEANREAVGDAALDGSVVATAILQFVPEGETWRGTVTDLGHDLRIRFPALTADRQAFPRDVARLGAELRRVEPLLRRKRLTIMRSKEGRKGMRILTLKRE